LIDVPLLDKIYTILGQYEELLEQYIASGRLRRLLNSNRMRRKLEKINSDLHVRRHRCRRPRALPRIDMSSIVVVVSSAK
jgi:hypothetical protein